MSTPDHRGDTNPIPAGDLDLLVTAQRTVDGCVDDLIGNPFHRRTYTRLAGYLESDAWRAADAFDRLIQQPPAVLRDQLESAATGTTSVGAGADPDPTADSR